MNSIRLLSARVGLIVFACGAAWAQQYPTKPVRVVIVFPPGGATDIVGRIAFQKVGEQLDQQFVIDNRAGAGGTIGAAFVAKSPPDGYTLMVYSTTLRRERAPLQEAAVRLAEGLRRHHAGRAAGERARRASVDAGAHGQGAHRAREERGPARSVYGSAGVGALQHLSMSLLANMAKVKMVHVPYKGGGPAAVATAARRDTGAAHTDIGGPAAHPVESRAADRGVLGASASPSSPSFRRSGRP